MTDKEFEEPQVGYGEPQDAVVVRRELRGDEEVVPVHAAPAAPRYSIAELERMAQFAAQSKMFPGCDTPAKVMTLFMVAQAENKHPMQALMEYDLIPGRDGSVRPALKAQAIQARFQERGGRIKWLRSDDKAATAEFHTPKLVQPYTHTYSIEDAYKAGLAGRDNYKRMPKEMLRSRCMSSGIRMVDPGAIMGRYSTVEVSDFMDEGQVEVGATQGTGDTLGVEPAGGPEPTPAQEPDTLPHSVFDQLPEGPGIQAAEREDFKAPWPERPPPGWEEELRTYKNIPRNCTHRGCTALVAYSVVYAKGKHESGEGYNKAIFQCHYARQALAYAMKAAESAETKEEKAELLKVPKLVAKEHYQKWL